MAYCIVWCLYVAPRLCLLERGKVSVSTVVATQLVLGRAGRGQETGSHFSVASLHCAITRFIFFLF